MEEVTFTPEYGHSREKMQGDDSSICQTYNHVCCALCMSSIIEFLQQAALGKLFNYCHFADEVIGP